MADPVAAGSGAAPAAPAAQAPAGVGDAPLPAPASADGKGSPQTPPAGAKDTLLGNKDAPVGEKGSGETGKPEGKDAESADFQISVPKGMEVDQGMIDGFKGIAKELGLKGEQAQKVADWYFKSTEGATQKMMQQREEQILKWAEEAKSDKEIGGKEFQANLNTALKAMRQYADKEVVDLINSTGLGNHKAMIRMFAKIGKAIAEDKTPPGMPTPGADVKREEIPLERQLYPSMFPKE